MDTPIKNPSGDEFTHLLLEWFENNARKLPWRETKDPYHVWLSEIMLQQTRVVAVIDYYHRFLGELPRISDLAYCPEDKLMKLWQGLGYYNRARNLQKSAIEITEEYGGIFPDSYENIIKLSGIGEYTAGAIASTVYDLRYTAVDGNVLRVVARFTGNYGDIATSGMKKEVTAWVLERMPHKNTGKFNQGLMELGATVCLPNGAPLCEICPVFDGCACGKIDGSGDKWRGLPVKSAKKPRKIEYRQVFLLSYGGKFVLRKRPSKGILANLWEFPQGLREEKPWEQWGIGGDLKKVAEGKHIFTHIEWRMEGFALELSNLEDCPMDWVLVSLEELEEVYSVPSAFSFISPVDKGGK